MLPLSSRIRSQNIDTPVNPTTEILNTPMVYGLWSQIYVISFPTSTMVSEGCLILGDGIH